jgi:hypothetical protein
VSCCPPHRLHLACLSLLLSLGPYQVDEWPSPAARDPNCRLMTAQASVSETTDGQRPDPRQEQPGGPRTGQDRRIDLGYWREARWGRSVEGPLYLARWVLPRRCRAWPASLRTTDRMEHTRDTEGTANATGGTSRQRESLEHIVTSTAALPVPQRFFLKRASLNCSSGQRRRQ